MRARKLSTVALLLILASATDAQERCADGGAPVGTIGVAWFHCVGGICRQGDDRASGRLEFTTEPRLRDISPAAARLGLVDGDVLVAVDGIAITLPEAGRRLARLRPGEAVKLTIRRDRALREVAFTALPGCAIGRVAVTSDTAHPATFGARVRVNSELSLSAPSGVTINRRESGRIEQLQPRPNPGTFGIAIACGNCGWVDSADEHRWRAFVAPVIAMVDSGGPAANAGIKAGDVLTHIDDLRIDTDQGSQRLADVRGDSVYVLRVMRAGHTITLAVRARRFVP